jgi:hypothetical protein
MVKGWVGRLVGLGRLNRYVGQGAITLTRAKVVVTNA